MPASPTMRGRWSASRRRPQIFRRSGVEVELGSDDERRIFAAVVRPERRGVDGNRDAEVERLRKEVARCEGMLANERFVKTRRPRSWPRSARSSSATAGARRARRVSRWGSRRQRLAARPERSATRSVDGGAGSRPGPTRLAPDLRSFSVTTHNEVPPGCVGEVVVPRRRPRVHPERWSARLRLNRHRKRSRRRVTSPVLSSAPRSADRLRLDSLPSPLSVRRRRRTRRDLRPPRVRDEARRIDHGASPRSPRLDCRQASGCSRAERRRTRGARARDRDQREQAVASGDQSASESVSRATAIGPTTTAARRRSPHVGTSSSHTRGAVRLRKRSTAQARDGLAGPEDRCGPRRRRLDPVAVHVNDVDPVGDEGDPSRPATSRRSTREHVGAGPSRPRSRARCRCRATLPCPLVRDEPRGGRSAYADGAGCGEDESAAEATTPPRR